MANEILMAIGAPVVFADNAQSPTLDLTLSALVAGGARISARRDDGAASKSRLKEWRATFQMATAGVVNKEIVILVSTSDGTNPDGEEGEVDADIGSLDSFTNMKPIGSVVIDKTSTDTNITGSGFFTLNARYYSIVVFNDTPDDFRTSASVHKVSVRDVPDEIAG